jgi:hypothetical protein
MLTGARRNAAWSVSAALLSYGVAASASPADPPELQRLAARDRSALLAGERVERPIEFTTESGHYTGGISYQVVRASPEAVLAALANPRNLPSMLPRTQSAREVGSAGELTEIELVQGQSPFIARYTIVLERLPERGELRFWLDPRAFHDIHDVWGFFRARPLDAARTLITVAAAVDLGGGIFVGLLEPRVQRVVLGSVTGIRDFLEPSRWALRSF